MREKDSRQAPHVRVVRKSVTRNLLVVTIVSKHGDGDEAARRRGCSRCMQLLTIHADCTADYRARMVGLPIMRTVVGRAGGDFCVFLWPRRSEFRGVDALNRATPLLLRMM